MGSLHIRHRRLNEMIDYLVFGVGTHLNPHQIASPKVIRFYLPCFVIFVFKYNITYWFLNYKDNISYTQLNIWRLLKLNISYGNEYNI